MKKILLAVSSSLLWEPSAAFAQDFFESVSVNYSDLTCVKAYDGSAPLGGGALVLAGRDQRTGRSAGGAYLVYDGLPSLVQDRGAIALYALEPNRAASLSIAPSGNPQDLPGEDTASLALQHQNGLNNESRFVAVMKKWGEMRFATISTGTNATVIPMTYYVGGWKLLEMTREGQVNLFYKGFPVMRMSLPYGVVEWSTPQVPVVMPSAAEVLNSPVLASAAAGAEISFKDKDGLIKKAIKQTSGKWLRVNDLKPL